MAEVGVPRPPGDDQRVVLEPFSAGTVREVIEYDLPLIKIEGVHLSQHDSSIRLTLEHRAEWYSDLGRRERAGRNLVDERLEQVEILPVDERHVDLSALQFAHRLQTGKATADHDNPLSSALSRRQCSCYCSYRSTTSGGRTSAASGSLPASRSARRCRSKSQDWSSETLSCCRRRRSASVAFPAASRPHSSCSSATSCSIVPWICRSSISPPEKR